MAPDTFDHVLLLLDDCHWYDKVPFGAVAVTESEAVAPLYTDFALGCAVIVGEATPTDTLAEFDVAVFVYPFSVFVTTHL